MRKVSLILLFILAIAVALFYFWGSSGSTQASRYHTQHDLNSPPKEGADTISVVTYNIGYLSGMTNNLPVRPAIGFYQANLAKAQNLLKSLSPDVIGFQEIDFGSDRSYNFNQLDSLSPTYHQAISSINWDKRYVPFPYWPPSVHFRSMLSGQAVLSKYPVIESEMITLERPAKAPFYYKAFYLDRLIQLVKLKIGQRTLTVLNVHLEAFDQETRENQAMSLKHMIDSMADHAPLILMGDFNARPPFATEQVTDESTMKIFYEHPQLSPAMTKSAYLANEKVNFTFDTEQPYETLDYIFYTHRFIAPVEYSVLHQAGQISDHLPVFFSFKFLE